MATRSTRFIAFAIGFFGALLLFASYTPQLSALGIRLFDDAGVDCDVYIWDGQRQACDRKAVLVAANNSEIPDGFTHARIYYNNIPTTGSMFDPQPSASFDYNQLSFSVLGAAFCPSYYQSVTAGANARDNILTGSYYDSTFLPNGTKVVDYVITKSDDTRVSLSSLNNVIGTKRGANADSFCKPSGDNYTQTFKVKKEYLRRVPGLLSRTFYIDLMVQVDSDLQKNLPPSVAKNECGSTYPDSCTGVAEHFFLTQDGPGTNTGIISSGDVNPLNTIVSPTYTRISLIPDGFGSMKRTTTSQKASTLEQSISVQSNDDVTLTAAEKTPYPRSHSSYKFKFAPDCTILPQGSTGRDVALKLYDVDFGADVRDLSKVLVLKYDKNGDFAGRLNMTENVLGYDSNLAAGAAVPASDSWDLSPNPLPKDQYYTKATALDPGNNKDQALLFHARPGEYYVFYLLNVRHGLTNQVGLPFDSAFAPGAGVAAGSCKATLEAHTQMSSYDVATRAYTAQAWVLNNGTIPLSADYERKVYFSDNTKTIKPAWGTIRSETFAVHPHVAFNTTPNTTNLPAWSGTAGAVPGGATQICTTLQLQNPASDALGASPVQLTDSILLSPPSCKQFATGIMPFFHALGGDILSTGNISGWNNNSTPDYLGAYAQIAALSSGNINNIPAGYGLSATGFGVTNNGTALAFANVNDSGTLINPVATGGTYGGSLETMPNHTVSSTDTAASDCTTIATGVSGVTDLTTHFSVSFTNLASGVYCNNAAKPLYIHDNLAPSKKVTIRSAGKVYISTNILYSPAYTLSTIPRLTVVTNGADIFVDKNVTELHGIFYAVRLTAGAGGNFYTCSEWTAPNATGYTADAVPGGIGASATNFSKCRTALKVYGAVSANKLHLARSASGLNSGVSPTPAESFIYSAEAWLGGSTLSNGYDAFTSLSPIF